MRIRLILVPYDSGAFEARMGRGPQAIMHAGLVERLTDAGHAVNVANVRATAASLPAEIDVSFAVQREVAREVSQALADDALPIVLSGNCNTCVGTVSALHAAGRSPAVCWFDAHADFNTPETSTSGFLDGMAVSILTGDCWTAMSARQPGFQAMEPSRILLFGTRSVDDAEQVRMRARGLHSVSTEAIARGEHNEALNRLRPRSDDVYLHIDLDVLDPREGPANSYAEPNGLSQATLHGALRDIQEKFTIAAVAFTAYEPAVDVDGRIARATIELALLLTPQAGVLCPDSRRDRGS